MDCGKCSMMKLTYYRFSSDNCVPVLWCLNYSMPCDRAIKNCELRVIDEKYADKLFKNLKIESERKRLYEKKEN